MREAIIFGAMLLLTGFIVGYLYAEASRSRRAGEDAAKDAAEDALVRAALREYWEQEERALVQRQKACLAKLDRDIATDQIDEWMAEIDRDMKRPIPGRPS